ncbi:MAG: LamG domain-containing protein [Verrucomicrobiales bacterium]|nr:LamG domain-containing protein [Verrucomicrobiales bacterium]
MKRTLAAGMLFAGLAAATGARAQTTLAEFQFNEGSGGVTASPTNALSGTLGLPLNPDANPIVTTDTPSGAAGDRAIQLTNGAFLVVDDSVSPVLALQTSPLTLEAWVKRDSTSTAQYEGIMAYGGAYKLGLNNSEIIFTLFGVVDISSSVFLTSDEWHHVAVAWEPGVGVTFYLDGAPTFIADTSAMGSILNNFFNIGAERLGTTITGTLDRVRVHQGLLTPEQLDSVAATPKAPLASTLVSYALNEAALPNQNGATAVRPTIAGNVVLSQQIAPTWVKDSPSGAANDTSLEFSGGKRVVVPDPNAAITLDTGDFTVQAWVKFGAQPAARSVLVFNNGPGGAFSFSISSRKAFVTTLGILDQPSNAAIPDDGAWHHVAVVHETGKEFRFYVDGQLGDTVAYTGGVLIGVRTGTEFYLGSEGNGGLPYAGLMDRVIISAGAVPAEKLDFRAIPGVDPGAPGLSIQTVAEVAWPTVPAGYRLQVTTTPDSPASWTFVTDAPIVTGGSNRLYTPITQPKSFYRLVKP